MTISSTLRMIESDSVDVEHMFVLRVWVPSHTRRTAKPCHGDVGPEGPLTRSTRVTVDHPVHATGVGREVTGAIPHLHHRNPSRRVARTGDKPREGEAMGRAAEDVEEVGAERGRKLGIKRADVPKGDVQRWQRNPSHAPGGTEAPHPNADDLSRGVRKVEGHKQSLMREGRHHGSP